MLDVSSSGAENSHATDGEIFHILASDWVLEQDFSAVTEMLISPPRSVLLK